MKKFGYSEMSIDMDCHLSITVFPRFNEDHKEYTDEEVKAQFGDPDGRSCTHAHDCCGQWYPGSIEILRGRTTIVVTQYWSLNV